jgi:TolA-binding protein
VGFDPYALLGLAKIHHNMKHYDEAEACCHEILKEMPEHPRAMEELAMILEHKGDIEAAQRIREQLENIE